MFPLILEIINSLCQRTKSLHFVILQNNNELRATGGFITQLLVMETGFLKFRIFFKNVYTDITTNISRDCPEVMKKMLFDHHTTTLQFRDANYDPQFDQTALLLSDIYRDTFPESNIATVTSVNSNFIEVLLRLVHGVSVAGKRIDEKNFFSFLSSYVSDIDRHSKEALENRKGMLKKLFISLCQKLLIHFYLLPFLLLKIRPALRAKDIQYYIFSTQKSSSSFEIQSATDTFSLIEDNYLGLKSNRYIQRTIFHDTFIDSEKVFHNKAAIEWRHHGTDNYPISGHYRGRVRIYLPRDVLLDTCTEVDEIEITKSDTATILSFSLFLDPLETYNFEINYTLQNVSAESYKFNFIKQSGVSNEILMKSLHCTHNSEISERSSSNKIKDSLYFFDTCRVNSDITYAFDIQPSKHKPRVTSHEIIKQDTALVEFNEEISITDTKVEIYTKDIKEKVEISEFFLDSSKKILVVKVPFPNEEEKFYTIRLQDIKNKNGISIDPNPRELTLVYRSKYFR